MAATAKFNKSYACIIAAAVLWGCIVISVRNLGELGFSNIQIVFVRSFVALITIIPVILIKDVKLFKIKIRDIWCFIGTGVISLLMFNVCYFYTMELTNLGIAAVLLYTAPAFVCIFSVILFKEKITAVKMVSMLIILAGCTFVSGIIGSDIGSFNFLGVVLGLCSGIGYALYSIFSRYALNKGYNTYTISFYTFLLSAIASVPFANIKDIVAKTTPYAVLFFIAIGFFCCTLPYLLYTQGLCATSNTVAAMLATIEPVVAAFIGAFVFHDEIGFFGTAGIILILIGICVMNIKPKNKKKI